MALAQRGVPAACEHKPPRQQQREGKRRTSPRHPLPPLHPLRASTPAPVSSDTRHTTSLTHGRTGRPLEGPQRLRPAMCVAFLLLDAHPELRLVLTFNRDEMLARCGVR